MAQADPAEFRKARSCLMVFLRFAGVFLLLGLIGIGARVFLLWGISSSDTVLSLLVFLVAFLVLESIRRWRGSLPFQMWRWLQIRKRAMAHEFPDGLMEWMVIHESTDHEIQAKREFARNAAGVIALVLPKLVSLSASLGASALAAIDIQSNSAVWWLVAYELLGLTSIPAAVWLSSLFAPRGMKREFRALLAWDRIAEQRQGSVYVSPRVLNEFGVNRGLTPKEDIYWLMKMREKRTKTNPPSSPSDR